MTRSGWIFKVEIISKNTLYTKEMRAELERLLQSSPKISKYRIEEDYDSVFQLLFAENKKREEAPA